MSIVKELRKQLAETKKSLVTDKDFLRLQDFYSEMKQLGVAKSPTYDLPPLDTLGKRFFDIQHSSEKPDHLF